MHGAALYHDCSKQYLPHMTGNAGASDATAERESPVVTTQDKLTTQQIGFLKQQIQGE